jgi:hypothetical protein
VTSAAGRIRKPADTIKSRLRSHYMVSTPLVSFASFAA